MELKATKHNDKDPMRCGVSKSVVCVSACMSEIWCSARCVDGNQRQKGNLNKRHGEVGTAGPLCLEGICRMIRVLVK